MRGLERSQPARARLYMLARLHRAELYRLSHASIRREFTLKKQLTLHSLRLQPKRRFRRSPVRTTQDERKRSTFRRREPRQRTLGGRGAAAGDPDQQRQRRYRRNRGEDKERHPTELVREYPAGRRHQRASHRRDRREQRVLSSSVRRRA